MLCMKLRSRVSRSTVVLVTMALAMTCIWAQNIEGATLRAGVAVRDITVDAPTKNVHDPLYAKALVLDDGTTKAVIICVDIGSASGTLVAEVRQRVQDAGPLLRVRHARELRDPDLEVRFVQRHEPGGLQTPIHALLFGVDIVGGRLG